MKRVSSSVFGLGVLLLLTVAAMKPVNGFNCSVAKLSLIECFPFLERNQDIPSTSCCNVVSNVRASAPTKPELREACQCFTEGIVDFPKLDKDRAIQLPKLCNVDIGFPLTKDIDCNK
ncbi:non-specific lipid-transfer protein A-like [Vigna radiata var. radiata]|uniref:Non-specific lipid-transfer protein n=1 Tax=Vigna radiata var. radiata TaxID=3916 RepID=A0A3Q0F469_VIGRR|nr:non-specific lipid-transfer protein A-like [Vigna radiata var. radiata]